MRDSCLTLLSADAGLAARRCRAARSRQRPVAVRRTSPLLKLGDGVVLPRSVYRGNHARAKTASAHHRAHRRQRASDAERLRGSAASRRHLRERAAVLLVGDVLLPAQTRAAASHDPADGGEGSGRAAGNPARGRRGRIRRRRTGRRRRRPRSAPPAWASNLLWGGLLWITIGICRWACTSICAATMPGPGAFAAVIYGVASVVTAIRQDATRSR